MHTSLLIRIITTTNINAEMVDTSKLERTPSLVMGTYIQLRIHAYLHTHTYTHIYACIQNTIDKFQSCLYIWISMLHTYFYGFSAYLHRLCTYMHTLMYVVMIIYLTYHECMLVLAHAETSIRCNVVRMEFESVCGQHYDTSKCWTTQG